ncbi:hypothetical protein AB0D00_26545 [Streptomyces sp. NPDC048213]|uniref:hypothetical protein n=1 Tax=Streptomyces sp. NPDC048213 TaxID=3160984 RepID=UPI0033D13895
MPLSVPLLLVPGEPDRHYTVHTQRVRWDGAQLAEHGNRGVSALTEAAREGLRYVECVAAELADADVEVIQHPDGAEAVARVLCTEDECAAVAEQYHRDAYEDVEAEAARAWAATWLQNQTVELLRLREEFEKPTHAKTPASAKDMLAAVLAVQQERTGGSTDRIVLMLDEAAFLLRDNGLFTDRSREEVRREMDRLIRQNRASYSILSDGIEAGGEEKTSGEMHPEVFTRQKTRIVDLDGSADLTAWMTPAAAAAALPDRQLTAAQEAQDMEQERADAAVQDANLARLSKTDPDAARIFRPGMFSAQLDNTAVDNGLGNALELYAATKRDQGRMDLFRALFVGTTAEDSQ